MKKYILLALSGPFGPFLAIQGVSKRLVGKPLVSKCLVGKCQIGTCARIFLPSAALRNEMEKINGLCCGAKFKR